MRLITESIFLQWQNKEERCRLAPVTPSLKYRRQKIQQKWASGTRLGWIRVYLSCLVHLWHNTTPNVTVSKPCLVHWWAQKLTTNPTIFTVLHVSAFSLNVLLSDGKCYPANSIVFIHLCMINKKCPLAVCLPLLSFFHQHFLEFIYMANETSKHPVICLVCVFPLHRKVSRKMDLNQDEDSGGVLSFPLSSALVPGCGLHLAPLACHLDQSKIQSLILWKNKKKLKIKFGVSQADNERTSKACLVHFCRD